MLKFDINIIPCKFSIWTITYIGSKGFHVSYMENVLKWHHGVPTAEEYEKAIAEITNRIEELKKNC